MADNSYTDILKRAQDEQTPDEKNKLAAKLSQEAACKPGGVRHSILELEGLGKSL